MQKASLYGASRVALHLQRRLPCACVATGLLAVRIFGDGAPEYRAGKTSPLESSGWRESRAGPLTDSLLGMRSSRKAVL